MMMNNERNETLGRDQLDSDWSPNQFSSTDQQQNHHTINYYGVILVIVPTVTILGNFLVILAVLRFKSLHTAINFLILGLAVADLLVGLFVMPYAVYIHVQGGYWFLGSLMCDIYSASDVTCSTASILLLTVISFDRYRAVSQPISYSQQARNIRRVFYILIAIWVISLAIASPVVLGVNIRPEDATPHECRFYNPEFSIISSIISFVIPCFIVLFIYIRIMLALRKRQKAANLRNSSCGLRESFKIEKSASDESILKSVTIAKEVTVASTSKSANENIYEDAADSNDVETKHHRVKNQRSPKLRYNAIKVPTKNTFKLVIKKTLVRHAQSERQSNLTDSRNIRGADNENIDHFDAESTESSNSESNDVDGHYLIDHLYNNASPCPCKQAIISCNSRNGIIGNNVILIPRPEVYKYCQFHEDLIYDGSSLDDAMQKVEIENDGMIDTQFKKHMTMRRESEDSCNIEPSVPKVKSIPKATMSKETQMRDKKKKDSMRQNEIFRLNKKLVVNARRNVLLYFEHWIRGQSNFGTLASTLKSKIDGKDLLHRRREHKNHSKEKRATKTLGIVVGTFLVCWVPFFSIYIMNAVCILCGEEWCQVGFLPFFYTTWLGYINSSINPIIYTIFNREFRRAFKTLMLGKNGRFFFE